MKKRFKVEANALGFSCKFVVEIDEGQDVVDCYDSDDTSYIFDDINGIRHIIPREHSLIEIHPLIAEIIYKDGIQEQKEK